MLKRLLALFLLLITITLFLIGLRSAWPFTADDAYITLRYAKHLVDGYGIVWNIGQAPLEGYSNFTYLLLGSLLYYCHLPIIENIRYFSLFSFILTGWVMYRTMRLWVSPTIALLPLILLLSYPGSLLWGVSGLETPFVMLLIVSTVYSLLCHHYKLAGLFIAIAGLTRPEAPLFFVIFWMILYYNLFRGTQKNFRPLFSYTFAFISIYLPYFLWRLYYFGHFFPNPVYCKFLNNSSPFSLIFDYFKFAFPLLALSLPAWLMKKPLDFLYYFTIPTVACFAMLYGVDPIVGTFNRYALPFFVLLTMSSVLGCKQLIQHFQEGLLQEFYTALLVLIVAIFIIIIPSLSFNTVKKMSDAYYLKNTMRTELGQWFDTQLLKNSEKISDLPAITLGDCGLIPFFLDKVEIVDSLCLNSREMTGSTIHLSYSKFVNWVLEEKQPFYIVLAKYSWNKKFGSYPFETLIKQDSRFKENYNLIKKFSLKDPYIPYQYAIYQKNQKH